LPAAPSSPGWKQKHERARHLGAARGERFGRRQQDRDVPVVPAGVHDAVVLGDVVDGVELADRQRVHVGAQQGDGPGLAADQRTKHAGLTDLRAQVVEPERRRASRPTNRAVSNSTIESSGVAWSRRRARTISACGIASVAAIAVR
jgi:hypothetical protein